MSFFFFQNALVVQHLQSVSIYVLILTQSERPLESK